MSWPNYETKQRDLDFYPSRTVRDELYFNGTKSGNGTLYSFGVRGHQSTWSRGNPRHHVNQELDRRAKAGRLTRWQLNSYDGVRSMDVGGNFETTRHEYTDSHLEAAIRGVNGSFDYRYNGPVFAYTGNVGPTSPAWPKPPSDLLNQMIAKGTTAIARTAPTNPSASTAQFLGELREGLPRLPGSSVVKRGGPGGVADEYVNVEFGIKPLISDLQNIWQASQTAEKRIAQLERDSGRLVRRRYSFPVERTVEGPIVKSDPWLGYPGLRTGTAGSAYNGPTGKLYYERTLEVRTWFSGAYTYLYPKGDSSLDKMRRSASRLRAVYGLDLNPELFWELTPWSWAVDWVSNLGDVMTNISRFSRDGLVMRWGYVMCTWKCTDTYTLVGQSFRGVGAPTLTQSFTTTVKKRVKATPYGFGLDLGGLSTRQWAILGALGISRAQGQLE
ncbi:maturation protein [ssRNA phage Gerhypos.4_1]|uniref:Maturation protein n=2 Tax=Leviviricetes TaxID=2842243 RepID=A0A8S5L0C3_9VIRU|nr:maturation protein [ssRNA phage Gerhypos.4_1]QDH91100.1 MAG: hypothetical protein H4Bulk461786_000004 [Leviviridae sp.]DAD51382.1 TPA_asm: maturation protein [ssRNA phage Gerhypos.4_1]